MNLNEFIKKILLPLWSNRVPFVCYHMPQSDDFVLLVNDTPKEVNLENFDFENKGFVLFPYESNKKKGIYFSDNNVLKYNSKTKELFGNPNKVIKKHRVEEDEILSINKEGFEKNVALAINLIKNGLLQKVVVSKIKTNQINNFSEYIKQLFESYPNTFTHLSYTTQYGLWLGASPEILLERKNNKIKTIALAGTQLGVGKETRDAQWTQKEIAEQALVTRYIINRFKEIRLREFEDIGPKTVKAGHLFHLLTEFHIDEKEVNIPNLFTVLVKLLHPTSAVCGMPLAKAEAFIKETEIHNRNLFTGFLGPINMGDESHLFVNLRTAKIVDKVIYTYAGAGITIDSDPSKEWEETELKCNTMLNLLDDN